MYLIIHILVILGLCVIIRCATAPLRKKRQEKLENADNAKEQIREIVNRLIPNGEELTAAQAKSTEGDEFGALVKDGLIDLLISIVIGAMFRRYSSKLPDEYIAAFGKSDLYFIPVRSDIKTLKIISYTNKIIHFDTSIISKVSYNSSKFKTTFKMLDKKGKFTFNLTNKCFFTKSQDEERQAYSQFIERFQIKVDSQDIYRNK